MRRITWLAFAVALIAASCDEHPSAPEISVPDIQSARQSSGPTAVAIPFAPEPSPAHDVLLDDDDVSPLLPIGFDFVFFGNTYDHFAISSNGFITFDPTSSGCCSGHPIPEADGLDDLIAVAWTDLYPPGGGRIAYETRGEAPNRRLVVAYEALGWFPEFDTNRVTAQAILYEGTNEIEIHTAHQSPGHIYTQGVENADGTVAAFLEGRVASDFGLTEDAVRFGTALGRTRGGGRGRGKGPVVASATGSGHITVEGERRTFAFTARRYADGSVGGEWQRLSRHADSKAHGSVTCLTVEGGRAWIGGRAARGEPGEVGWWVEDQGQGKRGPRDLISLQLVGQAPGFAESYCADRWRTPAAYEVEGGNIRVRGGVGTPQH